MNDFVRSFVFGGWVWRQCGGSSRLASADNSLNVDIHVCQDSRCEAIRRSVAQCRENNQDYCDIDVVISAKPDNKVPDNKPKD